MAFLFLGLVALPLAAVLYLAFERLRPLLLEAHPGAAAPAQETLPRPRDAASPRRSAERLPAAARLVAGLALVLAAVLYVTHRPATAPSTAVGHGAPARPAASAPPPKIALPAAQPLPLLFLLDPSGPGKLNDPRDVAVDAAGNLYVADTGNRRVVKFHPDGSLAGHWSNGPTGRLVQPGALAIAGSGLAVLDSEPGALHKYDLKGRLQPGFEHPLGLSHPRGLTVDAGGTIYVSDTGNDRVLKVAADGSPLGAITGLDQPTSVALDPKGNLYVAEPNAKQLVELARDGTPLGRWYLPGAVTVLPPHLLWSPAQRLLVSLPNQGFVLELSPAGAVLGTWQPRAQAASPPPRRPLGLALAPDKQSFWQVWDGSGELTRLPLPPS